MPLSALPKDTTSKLADKLTSTGSNDYIIFVFANVFQSIILFLPKSAYTENKFDSNGQKKETMVKQYTLIHAQEKDLD